MQQPPDGGFHWFEWMSGVFVSGITGTAALFSKFAPKSSVKELRDDLRDHILADASAREKISETLKTQGEMLIRIDERTKRYLEKES